MTKHSATLSAKASATASTYHHGNLRQTLIEQALQMLEKSGLAGLSLRKLAAQIGVNQTALYAHFKNKNSLIAELVRMGFRQLAENSHTALADEAESDLALANFARVYLSFAEHHAELFKLMFSPDFSLLYRQDPSLKVLSEESYDNFATMISNYLSHSGSKLDPFIATLSAWSLVHGFCHLVIAERLPADRLVELRQGTLLMALLNVLQTGIDPR